MKTVSVAAQYKLPAVYFERFFVRAGGLMSSWALIWLNSTARRLTR
jgi:hypothetical protein